MRKRRFRSGALALAAMLVGGAAFVACDPLPTYTQKTVTLANGNLVIGRIFKNGTRIASYEGMPRDRVVLTSSATPGTQDPEDTWVEDGDVMRLAYYPYTEGGSDAGLAFMLNNRYASMKPSGEVGPDMNTLGRAMQKLMGAEYQAVADETDPRLASLYAAQDSAMAPLVADVNAQFDAQGATTTGITVGSDASVTVVAPGVPTSKFSMEDDSLASRETNPTVAAAISANLVVTGTPCVDGGGWGPGSGSTMCHTLYVVTGVKDPDYAYGASEGWTGASSGRGCVDGKGCYYLRRVANLQDVDEIAGGRFVAFGPHGYASVGSCKTETNGVSISLFGTGVSFSGSFQDCQGEWGPYHPPVGTGEVDTVGVEWKGLDRNRFEYESNDGVWKRHWGFKSHWRMAQSISIWCVAGVWQVDKNCVWIGGGWP